MGAQDHTERVLRDIHVLFSKAEPYNGSKRDVVVNKTEMMDLLKELNDCMYDMMDEYGLSQRKKEQANREMQKEGDEIIFSASRKAEDIYAASIMYTDNALHNIQEIMAQTNQAVEKIYNDTRQQIEEQKRAVKTNQSELKSQLEDMIDTQKYLRLIEDENRRLAKEKESGVSATVPEKSPYAGMQPEIIINKDYFAQNGIPVEEEEQEQEENLMSEEEMEKLSQDLDNEYFDWKEEGEKPKKEEKKGFSIFGKK